MPVRRAHPSPISSHIRRLDLSRDLNAVADLIEQCFPIHLDRDGQTYIRQMREAARTLRYAGWLDSLAMLGPTQSVGFVWEENHQIVGNLSLAPFHQAGQRVHLIANVAVHPDFRRRGIARGLTQRALAYLRLRNEPRVWLQVRDDNPAALALYRGLGFRPKFIRTTWRIRPSAFDTSSLLSKPRVRIRKRNKTDWTHQKRWLTATYPNGLRWNLPVDFKRFEPGVGQSISNFLNSVRIRHWTATAQDSQVGTITWQKTNTYTNNLWLAFERESEPATLPGALGLVLQQLPPAHPLSIDYPHDRHPEIFRAAGFHHFRTLIWMVCHL